jgi:WD40 repeat protein
VEVAHETLLTHWPRFAVWVDEAREDLVLSRRLDEAIQEWEATGRRPAYLLTGARLAQHRAWVTTTSFGLTERQQLFLAASARHDDELRIRSRRRRAWIIGGFATAALVAVVFGLAALGNARRASVEAMASSAVVALETDPELAVLLAAEAFDRAPIASAQKALHQALQGQRASMIIPPPDGALGAWGIVDPAGEHVAVVGLDTARLQMWEIGADQPMWETTLSDEPDAGFRSWAHFWFSADGSRVYVPLSFKKGDSAGLGLYTIDADSGETLDFLRFPCLARAMPAGGHFAEPGSLWAFDWGGVGKDATCGGWKVGGGVGVVDIDTGQTHFKVRMDVGPPPSLSEDGRYLGVGGWFGLEEQARARVFDTMSGEMVFDFDSELSQGETNSVLSRDGSRVLVGRNPSYLYDVATGERLQTYQGGAIRIRFTPDEQRVFATGVGTSIEVFDTESGAELLTLRGHTSWVADAAVDLEGSVLVSSSFDSVRVWDVASSMRSELSPVDLPPITGGLFLRDALTGSSQHLLVRRAVFDRFVAEPEPGNQPQVVAIVDTVDGSVSNHDVWHAELGPNGVLFVQPVVETDVATPSGVEGAVRIGPPLLVDTATGRRIVELSGCDWYWSPAESVEPATDCGGTGIPQLSDVSFAADGSTVLGGTVDGAIMIWDAETGEVLKSFEPTFPGSAAALYPDGRHMIREEDPEEPFMKVRDVITGAEVGTVDGYAAHTTQAPIHILEYHAAANLVIGAGTDLLLIDPDTLDVTVLTTGDWSEDVAVSPDGHLLATVGRDELVVVWDLDRMAIVAEIPVAGAETHGLRGVAFVDDETLVVAPASEDQLLRFTLNPEVLKDLALDSLNRGFQPEECATYDVDPCPSLDEMKARS